HGRKEVFSCAGIRDCVRFFTDRGHDDVLVFIPQFRRINGRRIVCHDDLYILKTAEEKDAVVVSNDGYRYLTRPFHRDLLREHPQYRRIIEQRLLMYSFVDGKFMPPEDPLGRYGPRLQQFLSMTSAPSTAMLCPYARKCTYGSKCKYFHPERPNGIHVSVTDRLMREKNQKRMLGLRSSMQLEAAKMDHKSVGRTRSLNFDPRTSALHDGGSSMQLEAAKMDHKSVGRTRSLNFDPRTSALHDGGQSAVSLLGSFCLRLNSKPSLKARDFCYMGPTSWHNAVSRISSAPLSYTKNEAESGSLYAPSTAVWGHSELSVGPLTQDTPPDRTELQYHLSKIFPESLVTSVLQANPYETNSQVLCQRILDLQREFS
ncbi:unnamed protein product, partial [Strongylus vulgaris]